MYLTAVDQYRNTIKIHGVNSHKARIDEAIVNEYKNDVDKFKFALHQIDPYHRGILNQEGSELTPEQEEWIDECVNEYCKRLQLFEKFTTP